jgi:hypothetical protein
LEPQPRGSLPFLEPFRRAKEASFKFPSIARKYKRGLQQLSKIKINNSFTGYLANHAIQIAY